MVCFESCITGSGLVDACVFSQVDILPHGWSGWYLEIAKSFNICNYSKRYQVNPNHFFQKLHVRGVTFWRFAGDGVDTFKLELAQSTIPTCRTAFDPCKRLSHKKDLSRPRATSKRCLQLQNMTIYPCEILILPGKWTISSWSMFHTLCFDHPRIKNRWNYCWWFRNPYPNHLGCRKPWKYCDKLPTSTGEFTGFLNHQPVWWHLFVSGWHFVSIFHQLSRSINWVDLKERGPSKTGWWFQPNWKRLVKMGIFPK